MFCVSEQLSFFWWCLHYLISFIFISPVLLSHKQNSFNMKMCRHTYIEAHSILNIIDYTGVDNIIHLSNE